MSTSWLLVKLCRIGLAPSILINIYLSDSWLMFLSVMTTLMLNCSLNQLATIYIEIWCFYEMLLFEMSEDRATDKV